MTDTKSARGVLFDLDGVLTDTAELHYQSWHDIADQFGIPFDRARNERLRGLSREDSLRTLLADAPRPLSADQQADVLRRKNEGYLSRVAAMTPADVFPGVVELLASLRRCGARLAVASSSRNARTVLERLELIARFDAVVDGNDAPRSKPDPQVFRIAAERLGVPAARCVVIEDAASGVQAARAAGMRVIGVGPRERVGAADHVVEAVCDLSADDILALVPAE
ncbi:MAG: beta-phosphoglucomutase [Planctomycetota bacterium]|nr:MAG: beta-phosphoglucomutase [Planctomycetota bacterium]